MKRKIVVFDSLVLRNVWFVLSAARPARIRKITRSLLCVFLLLSNLVLPDPTTVSFAEKFGNDELTIRKVAFHIYFYCFGEKRALTSL